MSCDVTTRDAIRARGVELAYHADDLPAALETLAERARENGLELSARDLDSYLESELGGRTPSYSGAISDSLRHLESLGRCFSWTTTEELEAQLSNVP